MNSVIRQFEDDPISRHEAGEGWAPHGLDAELLSAIALRETFRLRLLAASAAERIGLQFDLDLVTAGVERMKYDHDMPQPPSA